MPLKRISQTACFGGEQGFYQHGSDLLHCDMGFSVYLPPRARNSHCPVLWYLSGLTCTAENVTVKAGFQRVAAELGLIVVCPDTSPRGEHVPDVEDWDFGQGAGFYVNATEAPWRDNYQMYDYVTAELPALIAEHFPVNASRQGIMGHSMGGHGALIAWVRNRHRYRSVSAFSPIVSPLNCSWGEKALRGYLGDDRRAWAQYDSCLLIGEQGAGDATILVDQGLADGFLEDQLKPELLEAACKKVGQKLELRNHPNYDHSYYFIASFMEDHLRHHAAILGV